MIVEVYRAAGERIGRPIVELLLSGDALLQRGRAEMDANAHELTRVGLSVVARTGVRLGQLVEASDPASATPRRGKIVGIAISVRGVAIEHAVDLEVPTE